MEAVKPLERKQEIPANPRQQDKIIAVMQSGSLDALNAPTAVVEDIERKTFHDKIKFGALDGAAIDDKVIKNISAPFSGTDGINDLAGRIKGHSDFSRDFSAALQESVQKNFARVEGQNREISEQDVADFVAAFPTPRLFDETFIQKRREDLNKQVETADPNLKSLLKLELAELQKRETGVYPRLKAGLYGKRNEYWEQSKLMLKESAMPSQERDKVLDDLRKVGPTKPLGFVPIDTLTKACGVSIEQMQSELEGKGLHTMVLSQDEMQIRSGALFAYDRAALAEHLNKNKEILDSRGWPTDPENFIRQLRVVEPNKTPLYNVIADAFGDKTNAGRTDVLSNS